MAFLKVFESSVQGGDLYRYLKEDDRMKKGEER